MPALFDGGCVGGGGGMAEESSHCRMMHIFSREGAALWVPRGSKQSHCTSLRNQCLTCVRGRKELRGRDQGCSSGNRWELTLRER